MLCTRLLSNFTLSNPRLQLTDNNAQRFIEVSTQTPCPYVLLIVAEISG